MQTFSFLFLDLRKLVISKSSYAAHPTEPDRPEECLALLHRSFFDIFLPSALKSFEKYLDLITSLPDEEINAILQYYKLNLQLLAYKHGKSEIFPQVYSLVLCICFHARYLSDSTVLWFQ